MVYKTIYATDMGTNKHTHNHKQRVQAIHRIKKTQKNLWKIISLRIMNSSTL